MQNIARTHRLRRLRWQARAPNAADAFALRGLLREQGEAVQQAITRELDRLALDGAVLHLPRLVLTLDTMALSSMDEQLPGRVAAALREALAAVQVRPAAADDAVPSSTLAVPAIDAARAVPEAMAEALRHYLATGLLPWHLAGLAPEAVREALEAAAARAADAVLADVQALDAWLPLGSLTSLDVRIGALLRWLPLLPLALRRRWLGRVESPPVGITLQLARRWKTRIDAGAGEETALLEASALWLAWPARGDAPLLPQARAALRQWIARPERALARLDLPSALLDELSLNAEAASELRPPTKAAASPVAPHREPSTQEPLLVPLAGLVLLHPFLPRFLAGCGVLSEDGRAIAELPRACALLHALACGAESPVVEHQLPLIKLLLGLAPELPLSAALPLLNAADRDEVEALLAAVRGHWTALRGTGVDGLRLSFLQRRGLLRRAEGAWQLHLQVEAFDVLLGLLPWSISLVKLPWMAQPLTVEWGTP